MVYAISKESFYRNLCLVYGITFLVVLPYQLQNTKHSLYYRSPVNESEALRHHHLQNDHRLQVSRQYLNDQLNFKDSRNRHVQKKSMYDVLISIITTSRNRNIADGYKPHYLTQVIQVFLKEIEELKKDSFHVGLLICNVDSNPAFYEEVQYLSRFVTVSNRFNQTHFSMIHILEKEKQDYVFCLNNSFANFQARYHFLVEDDTLPKDNILPLLQFTVDMHLDRENNRETIYPKPDVLYVKFYHPERLLSYWSGEPLRWTELFGLSFLFASPSVILLQRFAVSRRQSVLWFVCLCYFTLVLLSIGRVNVDEFRQYFSPYLHSYSPSPSCCTPALLFPNRTIEKVIKHLGEHSCQRNLGKDSLLDQLVIESDAKAFIVQPNSFVHIGMYSALRNTVVHSSFV